MKWLHSVRCIFMASPLNQYLATLFQFLAGINFTLLYMSMFKLKMGSLMRNAEFRFYGCI